MIRPIVLYSEEIIIKFVIIKCYRDPIDIEGRTVGDHIPANQTGNFLQRFSASFGLQCLNFQNQNGISNRFGCRNYEVRYLCRRSGKW